MGIDCRGLEVGVSVFAPVPFSIARIQQITVKFLRRLKVSQARISIVFVKDAAMRRLNRESLGHDYVTDIVTFALSERSDRVLEGELVICPAQARRNARLYAEPFERELWRYVAHGLLHLKGYDDVTEKQRALMRNKEDILLGLSEIVSA